MKISPFQALHDPQPTDNWGWRFGVWQKVVDIEFPFVVIAVPFLVR